MSKTKQTYNEKLEECAEHVRKQKGSFSAQEVHEEMHKRGWLSKMDTVLDTHKLLKEIYGDPNPRLEE